MSTMDTLKASNELAAAGIEKAHAEAIARAINEHGRGDLVTKDYLDARLWQHTATIVGSVLAIATMFKLFS